MEAREHDWSTKDNAASSFPQLKEGARGRMSGSVGDNFVITGRQWLDEPQKDLRPSGETSCRSSTVCALLSWEWSWWAENTYSRIRIYLQPRQDVRPSYIRIPSPFRVSNGRVYIKTVLFTVYVDTREYIHMHVPGTSANMGM